MRKGIKILTIVIMMMSMLLSGCTIGDTEYVWDLNSVGRNDVLSINGEECTPGEARLYLANYQNLYGKEYGVDLWTHEFSEDAVDATLEEYVRDITLLQLSNIICMNQLAKQKELTLSDGEKELVKEAAADYYQSLTDAEKKYMDIDKNDLEKFYTKYAIAEKLYENLTEGVNEEVSVDEARVIRVQQIFVSTFEKAEAVAEELEDGDEFSNVAGTYNEASSIETTYARGEMVDKVEKAAFALDNDEISGMIAVDNGYYFIKCLCKNEEELTEKNKESIIEKRRKEQFDDVFNAFVEGSEFELNPKVWDNIKIDTSGDITTNSFFEVYDSYFKEK